MLTVTKVYTDQTSLQAIGSPEDVACFFSLYQDVEHQRKRAKSHQAWQRQQSREADSRCAACTRVGQNASRAGESSRNLQGVGGPPGPATGLVEATEARENFAGVPAEDGGQEGRDGRAAVYWQCPQADRAARVCGQQQPSKESGRCRAGQVSEEKQEGEGQEREGTIGCEGAEGAVGLQLPSEARGTTSREDAQAPQAQEAGERVVAVSPLRQQGAGALQVCECQRAAQRASMPSQRDGISRGLESLGLR